MFPQYRHFGPYLFVVICILFVVGWYTLFRSPCLPAHQYAQTAWGQGAWHDGIACPAKPWWRP